MVELVELVKDALVVFAGMPTPVSPTSTIRSSLSVRAETQTLPPCGVN